MRGTGTEVACSIVATPVDGGGTLLEMVDSLQKFSCSSGDCSLSREGPGLSELEAVGGFHCRNIRELSVLFNVSQALEDSFDLSGIARRLLRKLHDQLGMERGAFVLRNRDTGGYILNDALGLPRGYPAARYLDHIAPILARLVEGESEAVVAEILDAVEVDVETVQKLGWASDTVLVAVPLKAEKEVIGTLSIERRRQAHPTQLADLRLLGMIAALVSQAARVRQDALEQIESLRRENERLQEQITHQGKPGNMIGTASVMKTVYYHIEQVGPSGTAVILRGESGTGKELVARAIVESSPRREKPFIKFNCAALPDALIESELFGHEKGAFTGAMNARKGRFELADGGTLFLDEIGDVSLAAQAKLLRVLQEKEFERLGGHETRRADVRVIAATSRDLEAMIREGSFREDLYYRLSVFPIYLPPLRDRKCDILLLADHFIEKYYRENGGKGRAPRISSAAIDLLMSYHWPGNVRELENCMERAILLARGQSVKAHHLPPTLQKKTAAESREHPTLEDALGALEREMLVDALKETGSNMAEAARQLGLTERKMGLRVRKYNLDLERFRQA